MIRAALTAGLFCTALPALADPPQLSLPIDCQLGVDCYVQHYVDRDPGPGVQDFHCGKRSYDGHKGTDFALTSLAAMQSGVNVLAATDGTVKARRDSMPDVFQGRPDAPDVSGRECGNGVVIDHGGGWESQYCHLKRGSIRVEPGQTVNAGAILGQVGASGQSQFPHLHLVLRHDGAVIDPFDADQDLVCNDPKPDNIWKDPLPYTPGGLIALGFDSKMPAYARIKAGEAAHPHLPAKAPAIVLWAYAYDSQPGDVLILEINGPQGQLIRHESQLKKHQDQFFRAAGKRNKTGHWPKGAYQGRAILQRGNKVLDQRRVKLTIP
ncbi:MAG: peptidase M24 [Rhodobacterales bacterium]|nr:MAG: peptidase M24 [Rhodobacterales bacterium]